MPSSTNKARRAAPVSIGLDRSAVIAAALEEIDRVGLARFSVRAVARRLGVNPAVVAWHVGTRNQVLAEVVALVQRDLAPPLQDDESWQDWLRVLFDRFRGAIRAHPNVAPLIGAEIVSNTHSSFDLVEGILRALSRAGFAGEALHDAYNAVLAAVTGFPTQEFAPMPEDAEAWQAATRRRLAGVDPSQHPLLAAHLPRMVNQAFVLRWRNGTEAPLDAAYRAFVECMIAGLEVQRERVLPAGQEGPRMPRSPNRRKEARDMAADGGSRLGIQAFSRPPGAPPLPRIARAEGIWFIDTGGRRYLDASAGPVASNLGHGHPRVLAAMQAQARDAVFAYPSQFESAANIDFAERLTRLAGPGFDRAYITSGGSEAVETAIKFLRQHAVVTSQASRWKVIGRMPGYHGNTLGALAVSGDAHAHEVFGPLLRGVPHVPAPLTYRLPPNHTAESHARACATALEDAILREGPETVLAFIMEPVGGLATGALVAPDAYYEDVRAICTRHGVKLIYDEVMSGAGRTGRFLAADHWPAARPDVVVLAKGLSAGYAPMGAALVPARMAEAVAAAGGFMHGFTYTAHVLSCAVGAAVLREVEEADVIGNATRMGALLRGRLEAIAATCPIIGDIRGKGLLLALELVADRESKAMIPLEMMAPYRVQEVALRHGLALYCRRTSRGAYGDWIMVSPPLTITAEEVALLTDRLGTALDDYARELRSNGVIR